MSETNIRILPTAERVHPDAILENARGSRLKRVVIIGWDENGKFYFSGSENLETTIYMLRNADYELFKRMDAMEAMK